MPLRDHFRPPIENKHSWDELHGMWPAVIVQHLFPVLPEGYVAAPRVHLKAFGNGDAVSFLAPSIRAASLFRLPVTSDDITHSTLA